MADCQGFNSFLTLPGPNPRSLAQTWELHKSTVKKLYVDQGNSLDHVMQVMEVNHNFKASKKVYRRRLAKWGFEKNTKRRELVAMTRKSIERGAIGKRSQFMLRGRSVYQGWFSDCVQDAMSQELGAATPPHIRCSTPEPDTWQAEESVGFLARYAEEIEAYKTRSKGAGALAGGASLQDNNSPQLVTSNGDSRDCESQELPRPSPISDGPRATTRPNPLLDPCTLESDVSRNH